MSDLVVSKESLFSDSWRDFTTVHAISDTRDRPWCTRF